MSHNEFDYLTPTLTIPTSGEIKPGRHVVAIDQAELAALRRLRPALERLLASAIEIDSITGFFAMVGLPGDRLRLAIRAARELFAGEPVWRTHDADYQLGESEAYAAGDHGGGE